MAVMFKVEIHDIAKNDLVALQKAGLQRFIEQAISKLDSLAKEEHPQLHPRVTNLKICPGWYRYRSGDMRIIFRFTKSSIDLASADTLQITMVDLRDEDTYAHELQRRYQALEGNPEG